MRQSAPDYSVRFDSYGSAIVADREGMFLRRSGFHVDTHAVERPFSSHFPSDLADLVDIALAVYAADRLCPRRPSNGNRYDHHWHRRLQLEIPVRTPSKWEDDLLVARLRDLLALLTEDDWDFSFIQRKAPVREVQGYLFDSRPADPITVALFSGGLDSLAGLCIEASERQTHALVLFSGWTNSRLATRQERLTSALTGRVGRRVISVRVPFGITHEGSSYNDDEPTQRTRGFVYSLLGAAVALHAGTDALVCYENGIGALNLPITEAQLGSQNARSAHPVVLAELAEFVELALGRHFRMRLPFLFWTKAELCAGIRAAGLCDLIPVTVSCDGFPRRVKGKPQCGRCTSCLLRRQALGAAGLSAFDPADAYAFDVDATSREEWPYELHAMLDQRWSLMQGLAQHDAWEGLSHRYPQLESAMCELGPRGWDVDRTRRGIVGLYTRYCNDWAEFGQRELPLFPSASLGS